MSGKLIFTEYHNKKLAMLFSDKRLTAVRVLQNGAGRIGAVYIGKVKKISSGINACFVEIHDREMCFLPLKEAQSPFLFNRSYDGRLLEGDELAVQITAEAQKKKQALVSARISFSNEYFALSMDGVSRVGYSLKLSDEKKKELQEFLTAKGILEDKRLSQSLFTVPDISLPKIGGVIRTQAGQAKHEELLENILKLCEDFENFLRTAPYRTCFSCLREAPAVYQEVFSSFVYPFEYDEILTDDAALYEKLRLYCGKKLPDKSVRLYCDSSYPLHKLYSIETKLDEALEKRVWLKSGGYLIIEPTEALTVIDVNSGKYGGKKNSRENAYLVNLQAAEEVARQLRLRNLSGMIVVDFINMDSGKLEEALLQQLRLHVKKDKQKTKVVDMTPLGLVEITRKKCDRPLSEQWKQV